MKQQISNDIDKWIKQVVQEAKEWRHYIHSNPELAFEEYETARFVEEKLKSFGFEVETGWARTGVIGKLEVVSPKKIWGFRAELDALPIEEKNRFSYRSRNKGKMHACGHDGHVAGLLGTARILSWLRKAEILPNSIYLIFQPAEENEGGARKMLEEGLVDAIDLDAIFSIHNWPELPEGVFAIKHGPIMAAYDRFVIEIQAKGAHAAMPHQGNDVIFIATMLIQNMYASLSRMNPVKNRVLSFSSIHAGTTYNVLPESVQLKGTLRTFNTEMRTQIIELMESYLKYYKEFYGIHYKFFLEEGYPATINSDEETELVKKVIWKNFSADKLIEVQEPSMGSEDFSYFLQSYAGAYIWLGAGNSSSGSSHISTCMLHNPDYDFNDNILEDLIRFWVALALYNE